MDEQFIEKILQYIEDNLDNENFSVKDLASNAGFSRSMLHRKLKKLTGKSASELITEKRLSRAKDLLEQDVATASEIAYQVGFNSPSYFNKVFKKHYNISPGEVRRKGIVMELDEPSVGLQKDKVSDPKAHVFSRKALIMVMLVIVAFVGVYVVLSTFVSTEKSIAVLPLHNLTGQAENDYFVDGMHDALIGELGQIGSLRVISRTSTLRYDNSELLLRDIARELGVNTIVEGSVIGAGDSLRILIQLIDVFPKERHLLANEYRDAMQNAIRVQSSAAKDIANKIDVKLSKNEEQRLAKSRTVDPETYKAYLRGMYYLNQGTHEAFKKGINFLQEAITRDPGDPYAYAGLALGYSIMGHGQLNSEEAFLSAMSAAKKAIKLDPMNDEAYTALSILNLYSTWDWTSAKEAFENALAENSNNEIAHAHFAWYHFLFDDMEQSIYHAKRAVMIEPFSASYAAWLGLLYYHDKDFDNAEYWATKALGIKEDVPYGNLVLGWLNLEKKRYQQAIEFHEKLPENGEYWKMLRGYTYVKAGQREKALAIWNEMEVNVNEHGVNPFHRGMMAAYLGFTNLAFELLNEAYENKSYPITYINLYPSAESIRNDVRYEELLQKMNLPNRRALLTSN
jgi:AraC-like DNA-binding protein/TolB-like protein/Tfp pilus assembly protein PilF